MKVSSIRRVSVPVSDQQRAQAFYEEALGLETIEDVPVPMGDDARWIELASHTGGPSLVLVTWFETMVPGGVDGLMFEADDIDGLCKRVRKAGVAVEGPFDTPWGRQATLSDPDGNGIVLTGPAPSDG